ncbi:MAG: UbiD family decarboxylase, partial [Verrucomicrobia bacterium]|nr:UbiD family decarboxylase [Verrucomicrobiota bacterium]
FIQTLVSLATGPFPPPIRSLWQKRDQLSTFFRIGLKKTSRAPVTECVIDPPNLDALPILKTWPHDGGHFITLPLVYTQEPLKGTPNLGMYRIQRFDKKTTGLHFQIGKGGGFHYHRAQELGQPLPVTIFVGGPPALIISAIAPLPENVPELIFASLLQNQKLATTKIPSHPHSLISQCEFALIGEAIPHERRMEGPFGDHFGYYSQAHEFPVFHCKKIYHRKGAIYPATVVGKPIQEDLYIGDFLQKLMSPLFPVVMPQVKALHTFAETGFHPLAAAIVKERYEKECLSAAFRILGEGQLSLTKVLMITDQAIDITNIKILLETILARFSPSHGLYIFSKTSNDTLDYTGPKLNHGSKALFLGVGSVKRTLPRSFRGVLPRPFSRAVPFCPGCLLIDGPSYRELSDLSALAQHPDFADWPLLIVTDDAPKTALSDLEFLWTVFTRFDPAQDILAKTCEVKNHHLSYSLPLVIDARFKPTYPPEVAPDEATKRLVDSKWASYFSRT